MAVDRQQVEDFLVMLKQAHGEFREECVTKARQFRLYFVKRNKLKETLTFIQRDVPEGTKATPVPAGVAADRWKKLIDDIAAAKKLIREEQKKVAADAPMPPPVTPPVTSGPTAAKRVSRRKEARERLKNRLTSIYGKDKGKLRYRLYEKMAKDAGQEGSPQTMWGFFNGDTVEGRQEKVAARQARAAEGSAAAADAAAAETTALAPADAAAAGATAGTPGGLMATLWPTDKPIYMRPAAIVGGAAVLGVVGWVLLSPTKKTGTAP